MCLCKYNAASAITLISTPPFDKKAENQDLVSTTSVAYHFNCLGFTVYGHCLGLDPARVLQGHFTEGGIGEGVHVL